MNDYCKELNLNPQLLPKHIGIVMDGNGRWATQQNLSRIKGHQKGVDRVREIVESCGKIGIQALTLYAFSEENWRRPEDEVDALMNLLRWYIPKEQANLIKNNVQFRVIGDRNRLSRDIINAIEKLEYDSKNNTGLLLSIALSYGGRSEIVRAVKKVSRRVATNEFFSEDITEDVFERFLDTAGLPAVDMFIRTSGEYRISNFLLWQIAYAELFFEKSFWPDFDTPKLVKILKDFAKRERRFGMTSAQIKQQTSSSTSSSTSTSSIVN